MKYPNIRYLFALAAFSSFQSIGSEQMDFVSPKNTTSHSTGMTSPTALIGGFNSTVDNGPTGELLKLVCGEWLSRSIYVVTKLEVADHLGEDKRSIQELAALSKCNEEGLNKVMSLLVVYGIFQQPSLGVFANNEASDLLAKSNPNGAYSLVLLYGEEVHQTCDKLLASVQTGKQGFQLAYKKNIHDYIGKNPSLASDFSGIFNENSEQSIDKLFEIIDFSRFGKVFDIGGGHGNFMQRLLDKYPKIKGFIYDSNGVLAFIKMKFPRLGAHLVEWIEGDILEEVPKGGHAYVLRSVLNRFDDVKTRKILKNCADAMEIGGRVIISECVKLAEDPAFFETCYDLILFIMSGGQVRSVATIIQLIQDAGLVVETIYETGSEIAILVAKKVAENEAMFEAQAQ